LRDGGAHRVHAGGPGIERGEQGQPCEFNVWTREAGAGSLAISVEGPSKAEIDFKDRKDGSCYVSYTVAEQGQLHTLEFMLLAATCTSLVHFVNTHLNSWKKTSIWKFQFFINFSNSLFLFKLISLPHALLSVSRILKVSRMWQILQAIYTSPQNLNIRKSNFKRTILAGHPHSQVFAD
jgi:Filamin/ABP280 repeat